MNASMPSLRRVNVLYTLVQLTYWAAFAAFSGYQTALLLGRGFSSGDAGVFAAIRCLAGIIAQPLLGGWADRHPQVPLKRILCVCLGLGLAVNAVFYCTRPGFWGSALIFLALGVLDLNIYPLLDSMAVQFINAGLDVNYSLGRGLGSLSYAVACVFLGRQSAAFGTESVLLTHIGLLVLLMVIITVYPTFPAEALPPRGQSVRSHSISQILRGNPSFSLMLAAVFCGMTAVMPIVSFMVNIVTDRGGDTEGTGVGQRDLNLGSVAAGAEDGDVGDGLLRADDVDALDTGKLAGLGKILLRGQGRALAEQGLEVGLGDMDMAGAGFNKNLHDNLLLYVWIRNSTILYRISRRNASIFSSKSPAGTVTIPAELSVAGKGLTSRPGQSS